MSKIYVFDDKTENMTAAENAITAAGHTMAKESWTVHRDYLDALERPEENGDLGGFGDAMDNVYQMIEDAGREVGSGFITDLMFVNSDIYNPVEKPSGIMLALHAIAHRVPVVICSLLDSRSRTLNHHSEPVAFIHDGYLSLMSYRREKLRSRNLECPFGWVEDKDWMKAVQLLEERMVR